MSAQFKPGDKVRYIDTARAVGSPFWSGAVYTVDYVRQDGLVMASGIDKPVLASRFEKVEPEDHGCPCDRCGKHHPATTCGEPEDKADLYVEHEPLKEAIKATEIFVAAMQAWGETVRQAAEKFGRDLLRGITAEPARCTSLRRGGEALWRCIQDESHDDEHASSGFFWTTADEDGRITKGGAEGVSRC